MAPSSGDYERIVNNLMGNSYTMEEAAKIEKLIQSFPTGTYPNYQWVNKKTKTRLYFSNPTNP